MNIQQVYDAAIVNSSVTGVDVPVWILSDDTVVPIVGVSNIINNFTLHNDMFFIGIEDQQVYENCNIDTQQLTKIKTWILNNKTTLLNHWYNDPYIFDTLSELHL